MKKNLYKYFLLLALPFIFSNTALSQCLTLSAPVVVDVKCNGGDDGEVTISVLTGVPNFSYELQYIDAGGPTLLGAVNGTSATTVTFKKGNGTLDPVAEANFGIPANTGSTFYRIVVRASGTGSFVCERKQTDFTIGQPASPLAITINSINPDCNPSVGIGEGDVNITASGGTSPYTFLWSDGATSEDRTDIDAGTYTVTATDAKGCQTNISVTIPVVTQANAGADQTVCADNATLAGNAAGAGEIGTWTVVSGTGTFANANSPTTTVGNLSFGANVFRWTITDAGLTCAGTTSTVTITRSTPASVDAGAPQTICNGGSATLAGVIGGSATSATWSGGTGTFSPNNTTLNATYTPSAAEITAGTVTLTLTTNDPLGPCPAVSDNVVITINATATVDAGPAQTICAGSTVTLAGTFGGSATGVSWSTSGDGTFNNITNPNAIYTPGINDRAAGTVTLTLSTDDPAGPCLPATDNVVITINPAPTVDAGPAQTVCGSSTITLAGTIGGAATSATWSGGTGTFSPNNTTLTAVYTPSAAEITAGSVTLTLTTNDPAGPCPAVSDNVVITLDPVATVDAGPAQTICAGSTVTLAGTMGGAAISVTWSGGGGTFAPNANTLNAVYTPSAAEVAAGTVTLTLTTNDPAGACPAASDNVVITISPAAMVDAGPAQTICGSSTVTLAGTIGGSATTATWSGGTGTFSPNNTTLNAVYTPSAAEITAGTVTLTLTTNDPAGACTAATDNVTITLDPVATVDAGAAQSICAGSTVTLAGTIGGGATTATWSGGTGTFSPNNSTLNAVYTPSAAEVSAGTVTLTLTTNDPAGLCPAATDNVTITITPAATVDAGPAQVICGGSTVTLAGTIGGSATSATWSGGTGTFAPNANALNAVYTPSAAEVTAGTVTLTLTTNDPAGACTAATDNVTITINQAATVDAGTAQTICAGGTVTLAGTIGGSATSATWSGGTGTFAPNNSTLNAVYTPSAAEVAAGTVTLTLTTNDPAGSCPAASDNVTITISPAATADAGAAQTICGSGTVTLAGTIGGSATSATWSGGTGTFVPNANTLNAVYTPSAAEITAGTVTLTLTTNDPAGACTAATDNVTITIDQPATVDAGAAQTICGGNTVTLAGTIGGAATSATWSGGTGSFAPNANTLNAVYTPSAAEIAAGTVTLTLATNDPAGSCAAASDNVTITISPAATVDAGAAQTICGSGTVTLAGTIGGSATSATWSGGTGTFAPNATTLNAVYTPSAAEIAAGTVTLTLTTNDPAGTCTAATDNVTITINQPATVDAGPAQTICAGNTVTLAGIIGGSATSATWSGGTGTFAPNANTLNAVYTPSAAEITAGTVTLTLTTNDPAGSCPAANDNVVITITPAATVNAGPDQSICAGNTVTLAGTIGGSATGGTWSGGTGTFAPNANTLNAVYTPSAAEVTAGTVTLTLTTAGPCAAVTDNVTITISPAATVNAGPDQSICAGNTVTLAGTVGGSATGGTWSGGTGTFAPNANTLNAVYTPSAAEVTAGTVTLTLTTTGPCATLTDNVTITINPAATVNAGPDQTICAGNTVTLAGTIGGSATGATWSGGTGTFAPNANALNAIYTPSAAEVTAGTVTLTLTTTGPCAVVTDNVTITISPAATANAGPDQTICAGGSVTLAGSVSGAATGGTWSGGTGTFTPNVNALNAVYTPSAAEVLAGTVTLTLTTTGPCTAGTDNITITINPLATVDAGSAQTICAGSTVTLAGVIGGSATSATWSGGTGTFNPNNTTLNAIYTPSAAEIAAGTVTLTLTTNDPAGPCAAVSDNVTITISPAATVNAGPDQNICAGNTVTLAGSVGGSATGGTWSGGTGIFTPNANALNAVYTPSAAEVTAGTVTLTLTTTGPCSTLTDDVVITISPTATVNAGPDSAICEGSSITLAGAVGGGATGGTWSGGTGTFNPNTTTLNAVYTPSAAEVTGGTVTLTLTTSGPCAAVSDNVTITISPAATVNAGADQNICAGSNVTLAGTIGGSASSATWSGGTGTFNPNTTTLNAIYTPSAAEIAAGTVTLTLTTNDPAGTCTAATDNVTIILSTSPDAGLDNSVTACNTNTAFDLFASLGGTPDGGGSWFDLDASGASISGNTIDLSGLVVGTYRFQYTVNGTAPCGNDASIVTVNVINTTPDAGSDNTVSACNSEDQLDLFTSLGGTPDPGGTWSDLDGSGAAINGNRVNLTTLTAGSYRFQYSLSASGCGGASSIVTVNVIDGPDAGADSTISVCNNTSASVDLFASLGGTPDAGGLWQDLDGSGAPMTGSQVNFNGISAGTYRFQYTVTGTAPCTNVVAIVTVNLQSSPSAGTDSSVAACNSNNAFDLFASLGGMPNSGGAWFDVDGSGASITGNTVNFVGIAAGTYHFQYIVTAAPCANDTAVVTVVLNAAPNAGTDNTATACNSDNAFNLLANLGGTPATGGTWSDIDGSGAVINGNLADFTSVTTAGTYRYQYNVSAVGCSDATAIVTIILSTSADAGLDNSVTACNTNTAFDLFASLAGTPDGGGSWFDLDGSGATISGNTVDLTGLAVGTYRFQYTVIGTAPCGNDVSIVTVNVINTTPDAGSDNTVSACNSEDKFNLFTSLGGSPNPGGTWSDLDGSGAAISGNLANLTTLTTGTYRYQYELSVSGCGSASSIVTVNVTDGPDAGTNSTISECNNTSVPVNLFASLGGTPDAGGSWLDLDGSGAPMTGSQVNFNGIAAGTYRFQYTVAGVAPCANAVAIVTVNLQASPSAGTDSSVAACNSNNAFDLFGSLGGTPNSGGSWFDVDGSGAPITGNTVNFVGIASGTYHFRYIVTAAPCANDTAVVTIILNAAPNAGTDNTATACNSDNAFNLLASLGGTPATGGTWNDIDGSGGLISANTINLIGVAAGTYHFMYTVTAAGCSNAVATLTLTVVNGPSTANAGPDQIICGGVAVTNLAATPVTSGSGTWIQVPNGLVVTPNSPTSQFIGAMGNSYKIAWVVTSGSCTPSIDSVVINFAAKPVVSTPITVCVNSSPPILAATAAGATSFKWYLVSGATRTLLATTITGSFTPGAELIRTTPGTFTYEVTAVYTCGESPATQIVVNVSNTGGCSGGGTGNCATVKITPNPKPATCTLSNGSVTFTIDPLVPAINNEGVIIRIDGVSSTNLNITRTNYNDTTFLNLPMGTYTYTIVYGDSSCIKPGTFTIDQSGTVGTPVASNIVQPVCAGTPTGALTLSVAGEAGNLLEWSLDGINWTSFTAGSQITGIPAGTAPTFEVVISVRRNASDPCNAAVTVVMQDANPAINATFDITSSTCNGNDGAITNITASGGVGGPYQYSLDGTTFQTQNEFTNISGGSYTLTVRDNVGCEQTFTAAVTFPGFIDFNTSVVSATCTNNGLSGKLAIRFNDPGTYQAGISADPLVEPTKYRTYTTFDPSNDVPLTFDSLGRGTYYVFAKGASALCATRQGPFTIDGVYALTFDIVPLCNDNEVSISLTNMTGEPGTPIEIQVFKKFTSTAMETTPVASIPVTGSVLLEYDAHPFLQLPDEYQIQITQVQSSSFCLLSSELVDYKVTPHLFAQVGATSESYPDILTGKMQVATFTGGQIPYEVRIELDSASVGGQAFQTDWEEVMLNNNLQYEKNYSNIPAGRYNVQVRDSIGCVIEIVGRVPLDTDIYIPNIFTPNEDGSNDVFFIRNLPDADAKLVITDRWGKQVYSTNSYQNNWDAEGVSDGIYYYRLKIADGSAITGWVEVLRGAKP